MSTFKFYRDQKVITWMRELVEVEAETKEEALEKVKEMTYTDSMHYIHKAPEHLFDFEEEAKVGDTITLPTVEIYSVTPKDDEELLWRDDEETTTLLTHES